MRGDPKKLTSVLVILDGLSQKVSNIAVMTILDVFIASTIQTVHLVISLQIWLTAVSTIPN